MLTDERKTVSETLHIDDVTALILSAQAAAYDAEKVDSLPVDDSDGSLTRMAGTIIAFARSNGFAEIPVEFLRIACRMADEKNAHFATQVMYDEYCRDRHAEETTGVVRYDGPAYDVEKAHDIAVPKPEQTDVVDDGNGSAAEEERSDGNTSATVTDADGAIAGTDASDISNEGETAEAADAGSDVTADSADEGAASADDAVLGQTGAPAEDDDTHEAIA